MLCFHGIAEFAGMRGQDIITVTFITVAFTTDVFSAHNSRFLHLPPSANNNNNNPRNPRPIPHPSHALIGSYWHSCTPASLLVSFVISDVVFIVHEKQLQHASSN